MNLDFLNKLIPTFIILTMIFTSGYTQSSSIDNQQKDYGKQVRWVGQYPLLNTERKSKSVLESIGDFIFGEKYQVRLTKPISILANNPDSFLVMDQANGVIFQILNNNSELPQFLKNSTTNFPSLVGICSLPNNVILFTDSRLNQIYIVNNNRKNFKSFNDTISLKQPTGIAFSKVTHELWVVETGAHRISVFNEQGIRIKTIGKRGNKQGEFNYPTFIWIDKEGNVYIVDSMNFRIQIFNKRGEFVSLFGQVGDATGYFARPKGIATDSFGNIYVVDALFHNVQIFDKFGKFLYYFGQQGRGPGEFWLPIGIFIDDKDFIYVADSYNSRVQIFQLVNTAE